MIIADALVIVLLHKELMEHRFEGIRGIVNILWFTIVVAVVVIASWILDRREPR